MAGASPVLLATRSLRGAMAKSDNRQKEEKRSKSPHYPP
jgi:hypothetical protein